MKKITPMNLIHDSTELRKLIAENPDLPIVVISDEESCLEGSVYTYMGTVNCYVCEILNAEVGSDCRGYYQVFEDRDDFEEEMAIILDDELGDDSLKMSDDEFESLLQERIKEYEPYWIKAIVIKGCN